MKTTYAQNNTRSLFLIVASMVLALVLFAALLGLSDKPDVKTVTVSPSSAPAGAVSNNASDQSSSNVLGATTAAGNDAELSLQAIPEDSDVTIEPTVAPEPTATPSLSETIAPAPAPTAVPVDAGEPAEAASETSETGAATLPTSLPLAESATGTSDSVAVTTADSPAAAVITDPTGTLTGNFFTRADEDEGATVARNEVVLTFDESGGGSFRGVLDITYANGSQVQIDMGGAFVYAPEPPQVMGPVNGTYRRDAIDDLEDVTTDRGDLSITSFVSGSGALCTPTCFGFTFPPPG